jgi:hypothetical protein
LPLLPCMALAALRYPVAAAEAQYSARHNMNIGGRSAGACLWAITLRFRRLEASSYGLWAKQCR